MPPPESSPPPGHQSFLDTIGSKAYRKVKARQTRKQVWFALSLFGMVGWAVAIPTVMGIAVGVWLDRQLQSQYSWTLMLLALGVALGCCNAWYWVTKESPRD